VKHPPPPRLYIRAWRERMGIAQLELAEAVGISQGQISNWESGARLPTRDNQAAVAHALGCDYLDLYREPKKGR